MHAYSFIDVVTHLEWSHDSNLVMIGIGKRSLVFVKSLHDPDWQCKIDEGMAGLAHAQWGPSLNHILTVSEFKIRLTIWSLLDKSVQYIRNPKFDDGKGIAFSPNRKLIALAEKSSSEGGRDQIGIYDATQNNFECLHHFTPDTFDLENVQFSGDGQHLIIWDSNLKCKLIVYQIQFSQNGIVGVQQTAKFSPYDNTALGIRNLVISQNKQYLIGGFFDQKLRVYNSLSWKEIFTFDLRITEITDDNSPQDLNIYSETESRDGTIYEVLPKPYKIPTLQAHQLNSKNDSLPRVGVSLIAISKDNKYLACKNEICPNIVWVWDLTKAQLNTIMIQKQEVEHLEFCPKTPTLNVSTGNGKLYLWTLKVASVCQVPVNKDNFNVHQTQWNPNGKSFAALDKNGLVFVYPQISFYDDEEDVPLSHLLKGVLLPKAARYVNPSQSGAPTYIWRNSFTEGYKVAEQYQHLPVDLSNYLFIRTRERQLLLNRVHSPAKVLTSGKNAKYSQDYMVKSLEACDKDINEHLQILERQLKVINVETQDFPAAFASNCMYILEKNGAGNQEIHEKVLLPILKKKLQYLHAEGVAQAMWALANAQIWDQEAWQGLSKLASEKDYNYEVVSNSRWSINHFVSSTGREHIFQNELTPVANQLYFQDKINLFELYNAALKAAQSAPALGLSNTVQQLEQKYGSILKSNQQYHALESSINDILSNQQVGRESRSL